MSTGEIVFFFLGNMIEKQETPRKPRQWHCDSMETVYKMRVTKS